jgi:hypothetical protein
VELMIALGVLGGGLALIGTIFPAAMIENKESVTDTMATIIAENGVVICRTLRHSVMEPVWKNAFDTPAGGRQNNLQDVSFLLSLEDRAYPVPVGLQADPGGYTLQLGSLWYRPEDWVQSPVDSQYYPASRYGWMVLARPIRPATWVAGEPIPNDWQFVVVPYRKFRPSDRPGFEVTFAQVTVSGGKAAGVGIGTLIVQAAGGQFGYVTAGDGTITPAMTDGPAWRLSSTGATDSPAIGCYVIRTGLSP